MLWILIAEAGLAATACVANDLCPAGVDPCVVSGLYDLTGPACVFDFSGRDVQLTNTATIDGTGIGPVVFTNLRDLTLDAGSQIKAKGTPDPGYAVTLTVGRDYVQNGQILTNADTSPGTVSITTGRNLFVYDYIKSQGTTIDGDGGYVSLDAGTDLYVDGLISVTSGSRGGGGSVDLYANGSVSLLSNVDMNGGEFDGGMLDIWAGSAAYVDAGSAITANGGGEGGWGGAVYVDADNGIQFDGSFTANGHTNNGWSGDGGELALDSWNGAISVGGQVTLNGSSPDGCGGSVDITANSGITVTADIEARSIWSDGCGGWITLDAGGGDATLAARLDATGKDGGGGTIDVWANGDIAVTDQLLASGGGGNGAAGSLDLVSDRGAITIDALVENKSVGTGASSPISLDACDVVVGAAGELNTRNGTGQNLITAHETLEVYGKLDAAASNVLSYRSALAPPVIDPLATVTPVATLVNDPAIPVCCPDADNDNVCNTDDACPGGDDRLDADGDGVPDACDQDLVLVPPAQVITGTVSSFTGTGGVSGNSVYLIRASALGAMVPPPCPTAVLGLSSPKVVDHTTVAVDGTFRIDVVFPVTAAGNSQYFQLLEMGTCRTSVNTPWLQIQ